MYRCLPADGLFWGYRFGLMFAADIKIWRCLCRLMARRHYLRRWVDPAAEVLEVFVG
jgi:hypothetical protein